MKATRLEVAAACSIALLAIRCGSEPARTVGPAPVAASAAAPSANASASAPSARPTDQRVAGECGGSDCFTTRHGFRYLHPTPLGSTLESVVAIRRNEAWAVGNDGVMLRLRPEGVSRIAIAEMPSTAETLEEIDRGSTKDSFRGSQFWMPRLEGIVARAPDDVYVLVDSKNVAHFDGERWTMESPGPALSAGFGDEMFAGVGGWPAALPSIPDVLWGPSPAPIVRNEGGKWHRGPRLPKKMMPRCGVAVGDALWLGADDGNILVSRGGKDFVVDATLPEKSDVTAIWIAADGKTGVAVNRSNQVFERSGDGKWTEGKRIQDAITEKGGDIDALWGTPDGEELWAVGDRIFRRQRDGSWLTVPLPAWARTSPLEIWEGGRFHAVGGTAPDDVWIVGWWGIALHWDGKSLRQVTSRFAEAEIEGLFPDGKEGFVAVAKDGSVLRSTSGDVAWESDLGKEVMTTARMDDGSVIAYTWDGLFVRRGPDQWEKLPKAEGYFVAAAGATTSDFLAVGMEGKAWRVRDGRWTALRLGIKEDLNAVAFAGPRDAWILGDGVILRGDGNNFRVALRHEYDEYEAIAVRGPNDVWIAGDANDIGSAGLVLHWDGKRFTRHENVSAHPFRTVQASAAGVWVFGLSGDGAFYDGTKWELVDTGSGSLSHSLLRPSGVLAAGDGGAIVAGPATFKPSAAPPSSAPRPPTPSP